MKLVATIFVILLSGCCALSTVAKFESAQNYWVGQKLSDGWFHTFVDKSELKTDLGNGDVEYFYTQEKCKYAIVINSNTRIVKSWSYKAAPEYCSMDSCG